MGRSNRIGADHGVLAGVELVAVPIGVLGTALVLAVAGGAMAVLDALASAAGVPAVLADVLEWAVTLGTGVILVTSGGLIVDEYRRFITQPGRLLDPVVLVLVPLLGLVGPLAYATTTDTFPLSLELFLVVTLSAHALAFRTIAWVSRRDRTRREGRLAGVLAGMPVMLAVITVATANLLGPWLDGVGRRLVDTFQLALVPVDGGLLVAHPVLVGGVYAGYRVAIERNLIEPVSAPAQIARLPNVPNPVRWARRSARTLTSRASADGIEQLSSLRGALPGQSRRADPPPVPTPPQSARSSTNGSPSRATATDEDQPVPRPPRSASAVGTTSDAAGGSSPKGGETEDSGEPQAGADETPEQSGETEPVTVQGSRGSESSGQSKATAGHDASAPPHEAVESGDDEFESDTAIYPASPETEDADRGAIDTCQDCGEELPSDGSFEFCPLCGHEL